MAYINNCSYCGIQTHNSTYCNDCAHTIAENPKMSKKEVVERVYQKRQNIYDHKSRIFIEEIKKASSSKKGDIVSSQKIMLIGHIDREDGGYMCPIGVVIPSETKTYQEAIEWLKDKELLVERIIESQCEIYNDETEEYVELTINEMTDFSYDSFKLHIDFEKDDYIYEENLDMDFLEVYQLKTENNDG